METAIKAAAAGVAAVLAALLIKKHNPEMSVAVYLAACAVILLVALGAGKTLVQMVERARKLSGLSGAVLLPVMKCVGIGIIARLGADVCRDAGSASVADGVELAGAFAALLSALPLLSALLTMLEELA